MKPNEVRNLLKTLSPMFKDKFKLVNEKKDGSFGLVMKGYSRIFNIEHTSNGAFIIKFYPFLDMSEGIHNWAVRNSEYCSFKTATVKRLMRSKYYGKQADYFMKKYNLKHSNEETTMGAFILEDMNPGEIGALISMTIIAHAEQLTARKIRTFKKIA